MTERNDKAAPQVYQWALQLREQWLTASCDHKKMRVVLPKIRDQIQQCCETLRLSADGAEIYMIMADDAVTAIEKLDMLVYGKASASDTQDARATTASLMSECDSITESIGNIIKDLRLNRVGVIMLEKKMQDMHEVIKAEKKNQQLAIYTRNQTQPQDVASGLPLQRTRHFYSCEQAIMQLEEGIAHVKLLEGHLGQLVKYWSDLQGTMRSIYNCLERFGENQLLLFLRRLRELYEDVRRDCLDYQTKFAIQIENPI